MAFLSNAGLERLWTKITDKLNAKVDKVDGKGLSTNDYTTAEKNKLSGIDAGANKTTVDSALSTTSTNPVQNKVVNTAISNLNTLVGDKSVSSQISTAIAGKADTGHTHSAATTSAAGFMSTADKTKLDGVEIGANKTTVDDSLSSTSTNPVQNKVINTALAGKAASDHTHSKSDVGLGNVDNTADANKSVKYATSAGSAASVTGTVDIAHGGTGRTNRDSGYSALMSGGTYSGDLNGCLNAGHYGFSSSCANSPLSSADSFGWIHVYTSQRDSANVLQEVTGLFSQRRYLRTCNANTWSSWQEIRTMQDAYKQEFKYIPSGADLNDDTYKQNGVYVSSNSSNEIKNLPLFYGSEGAFTLVVTGISNTSYTTQILYSISDPANIYVRNQYNWQTPWIWTNWFKLISEREASDSSYTELNIEKRSVEAGLRINRMRTGGNKYSRFYEANTDQAELAIAQCPAGGSSEGIVRIAYDGDYTVIRGDGSLYLGNYYAPITRFYFSDYGTSLPSAGTKGRVYFKKA